MPNLRKGISFVDIRVLMLGFGLRDNGLFAFTAVVALLVMGAGCTHTLQLHGMEEDEQTYRSSQFVFFPKPYRIYIADEQYIRAYDVTVTRYMTIYRAESGGDFLTISNSRIQKITHTNREAGLVLGFLTGFAVRLLITNIADSEPVYSTEYLNDPKHYYYGIGLGLVGAFFGIPHHVYFPEGASNRQQ